MMFTLYNYFSSVEQQGHNGAYSLRGQTVCQDHAHSRHGREAKKSKVAEERKVHKYMMTMFTIYNYFSSVW